jgi:hypothetical protein
MNSEMNDDNRKNHYRTIAIAGMGLLLIATAFTFSFANFGMQSVNAQQGGNATTSTTATSGYDTFTANGPITATIQEQGGGGNQTTGGGGQKLPYILGGTWHMDVRSGNVTDFAAHFIMVHTDGTGYHMHNITGLNIGNHTIRWMPGQMLSINGTADIAVNGTIKWPGVKTNLTFTESGTVLTIMPAAADTENHFMGQPIYGLVSQATSGNGTMIIQTTPAGQAQMQGGGGGGGNQTTGGPLGAITKPLQNLTKPLQNLLGGGRK